MKYVLLIDTDQDILNIQSMVLSSFYGGQVVTSRTGIEGIEILKERGEPELIVSDHMILEDEKPSLYAYLEEKNFVIPLIICSGSIAYEFQERKFPLVSAFVQKPFSIESLSYLVKSITNAPLKKLDYLPVKLPILLNFIGKSFDLYLKLSETNFVKVVNQGEPFTREDADKMLAKGITHLHISAFDSMEFLKSYEENLNLLLASRSTEESKITLTIDALEAIESISKRMGWSADSISSAQKSIETAIKILSKNSVVVDILKVKLANPATGYTRHIGLMSYLCCFLSHGLGWGGESAQNKLTLAALLHDLSVDESYYDDIKSWNRRASNPKDRAPETIKYRLHPLEASKMIQGMELIPPDVDAILLQHHERKDGKGFPRGLSNGRIGQLPSFFIIVEELVDFIGDGQNLETSLTDFITWGDSYYDSGQFKKVYQMIREKLKPAVKVT